MPRQPITPLRAIYAALVLTLAVPLLAQTRASLIGESRTQVVAQLGEPKSNIVTGPREMLFFDRVKVTLKDNVVVQVEDLPSAPAPAPVLAPVPSANTDASAADSANSSPAATATPAPAPLVIKFITAGEKPAAPTPPPAAKPARAAPAPAAPRVASTPVAVRPTQVAASTPTSATPATTAAESDTSTPPATTSETTSDSEHPTADADASETSTDKTSVEAKKPASKRAHWLIGRDRSSGDDDSVGLFSTQFYVLATVLLGGGIWYLWWRYSQRRLEMAATEVSRTPFETMVAIDPESHFTAELVDQLGQERFQKLVATYYAKTGVVAELAGAESASPMQIKIFWKDEPKPYAGVLCLANPPGLIDSKPLQDLSSALLAEGISRGYVVTNGRFSVEARDFGTEKQLTLLSGDIFLEKLNALPPTTRAELLLETNALESPPPPAE